MAQSFRIASFNLENLFSRAKVLNLSDHEKAEAILKEIARLKTLLGKAKYTADVKSEIEKLLRELKPYILIREDKGKLLSQSGKVSASGANTWDGVIEFKRAEIAEMARVATAQVMKAIKADVACVVEAEDRLTLTQFNREALGTSRFPYALVIDGNDNRGIDVGLYSKIAVGQINTHIFDEDDDGVVFSRDCLEVELRSLPNGKPLHILCNHLKSKGFGSQVRNDSKRKRQSLQIASILSKYDLTKDCVVVAGDLNDTPDRDPLKPLLDVPDLFDVLELQFPGQPELHWTYRYSGRNNQIDYILISKALKSSFRNAGVERRGIFGIKDITGETGFTSVTSKTTAASDHGAVWAEFEF